jgi:hypothetical protein
MGPLRRQDYGRIYCLDEQAAFIFVGRNIPITGPCAVLVFAD